MSCRKKKPGLTTADEPDVVDEPARSDGAVVTVASLRAATLPNKYRTFHEIRDSQGACFTSCSLDAGTGDVNIEKAVFFTVNCDGVSHSRAFVLGKLAAEAAVVTMRDAETV